MPARPQIAPTEDWRQVELLARAPGQRTYELIHPVVLFGQSPAERGRDRRRGQDLGELAALALMPPDACQRMGLRLPQADLGTTPRRRGRDPLSLGNQVLDRVTSGVPFIVKP
jgi:hypothetical protein